MKRFCKECGKIVKRLRTNHRNIRFCSTDCYRKYWGELYSERNRLKKRIKQIDKEFIDLKTK